MKKKFKLPKRVKSKWVKALRSGEYKQGHNSLSQPIDDSTESTYCCLGVACAIGLAQRDEHDGDIYTKDDFLPREIQEKLANYNDGWFSNGRTKSFKWIASYIDRYL